MKSMLLVLLLSLSTCSASLPPWQGSEGLADPHLGQVWVTAEQRWITPQALVERLASAPYVVVGEQMKGHLARKKNATVVVVGPQEHILPLVTPFSKDVC